MLEPIGVGRATPCRLIFILFTEQMAEVAANLKTSPTYPSGNPPPQDGVLMHRLTEEPTSVPQPILPLYTVTHRPPTQHIIQATEM